MRSYGIVEEEIDIGFGPQVWSFYVLQTQCLLLGKDIFRNNFFAWKFVPDDGSRTVKCRITNDTTGVSIMVTDDYVAGTTRWTLSEFLRNVFTMFWLNSHPSLGT